MVPTSRWWHSPKCSGFLSKLNGMKFFAHKRCWWSWWLCFSQKNIEVETLDNALNDEEGDVAMVSQHGYYVAINATTLSLGDSFQKKISKKRLYFFKNIFHLRWDLRDHCFSFCDIKNLANLSENLLNLVKPIEKKRVCFKSLAKKIQFFVNCFSNLQ